MESNIYYECKGPQWWCFSKFVELTFLMHMRQAPQIGVKSNNVKSVLNLPKSKL